MKKRAISILLLASILFSMGCHAPTEHAEGEEPNAPLENPFCELTEEIWLNNGVEDVYVYVGMSAELFHSYFSNAMLGGLYYLQSENNEPVYVEIGYIGKSPRGRVSRIEVYSPRTSLPSDADFQQLRVGMSHEMVYSLIGFPQEIPPLSGLVVYDYYSLEGTRYSITWTRSPVSEDYVLQQF